jgi:uncharacterized membrane protein YfcA
MSAETDAAVLGIILAAYFIRGITGFGSGLIAVPLLAHFMPLQAVVPLVLILDFSASLVLSRYTRAQVRWDEIGPLLPTSLIGILAGVSLLVNLPREPLLTGLGVFVLFFALRYLFNIHGERRTAHIAAVGIAAGFAGGLISALFGTGGPPYVIYLSHRTTDKSALRASFSGLFMLDGALRILAFLATGLLASDLLPSIALSLPVMAAGLFFGNKAHLGISDQQTLSLIGALLLVSGASLLWKVWG